MRRRRPLSNAIATSIHHDWLESKPVSVLLPFLGYVPTPLSLPPIITLPISFTLRKGIITAGKGVKLFFDALSGGITLSPQWGEPGDILHDIYPLIHEFGDAGELLYFLLVLSSISKDLFISLPYECFSSMSNYTLMQQYQNGKFKPLNNNTTTIFKNLLPPLAMAGTVACFNPAALLSISTWSGIGLSSLFVSSTLKEDNSDFLGNPIEKSKAMMQNPVPMLAGTVPMLFAVLSGAWVTLPLISFLSSKIGNYSARANKASDELYATHSLRRALNNVGFARIPDNIQEELSSTMLSIVGSGDHRASMQKYLTALFAAKEFEPVNDNLAINIAKEIARTDGGAIHTTPVIDNALTQSAIQHRGNVQAYIAAAAGILRANGVNYTRNDEADTRKFVEIVKQRQNAKEHSR